MAFMATIAQQYGGLARIPVRGKDLYLASSPALVRELLVTHREHYLKNTRYHHIQALLGRGLLLSEATEWRRQRLMTQPMFKADAIAAKVAWMAARTRSHLDGWRPIVNTGAALDVEPDFLELAQKLAGESLFGAGFSSSAVEFCAAATAVKQNWPQAPRNLWNLWLPFGTRSQVDFDDAIANLDRCVYECISSRRTTEFRDCGMLQHLAQASLAEGRPFTDRELRDQLLTLFFAGHETTATALCWIHCLLAQHPDVLDRLIAEVQSTLGGAMPTAGSLDRLQYTTQVIEECLRLYSPIHSISRVAMADHTLGGYRIPSGATVCVSLYALHRLPEYWPNPEHFDPDRFEPQQCKARDRFSYLPFAAGHRNCIGAGEALVELKLIVALIAQQYRLRLVAGQRIEPSPGTTMYPRYGLKMTINSNETSI